METLSARTALVVEDDDDIRDLLVRTLERDGFAVSGAPSGVAAIELARTIHPELVTLDVNLPGMSGLEVCRRLREHSSAYVIMISARSAEDDRLAGLDAGADDYLSKPFSPRELRARVAALFRRPRSPIQEKSELERAMEVQRGLLPETPPSLPGYEVAACFRPSRLVGGDLYDWNVESGQLHLTLADAMGKGMGAAMIAAAVRSAFRSVTAMPGLTMAFNHAAQSLTSSLESSGSYATVCTIRMNPASGRFSYVDAGHGIAAVVPADAGAPRRLEPCGPPVGLWGENQWESQREDLLPGESLVLVSDGVLDAVGDLDGTMAAMAEIVRAGGSAQEAADALAALTEGDPGHDDVTAVVVRRLPAS
ncbi:MAG: SpoIIE family protein phosphatase [Micrococcus sp.]|nr:SpoIIE family protein phosphatase [Micrococcus sp.]